MAVDPADLPPAALEFLAERHVATLTLVDAGGRPHVTPVGVTWDPSSGLARVITWAGSAKARLLAASGGGPAAVCQVDGGRWLTFEGEAVVTADPDRNADAVRRYAERYRTPRDRGADRRTIEITVRRVLGASSLTGG